jgi:hypothetical protein
METERRVITLHDGPGRAAGSDLGQGGLGQGGLG